MTTVAIYMPQRSGLTGDILILTKSDDFSALNGAGDALIEAGTSGWFTCDVAEAWTVRLGAAVVDSGGLIPVSGSLGVGANIVSDGVTELNSVDRAAIAATATQTSVNSMRAVVDGIELGVAANLGYLSAILAKLGAWTGTGVNTILGAFKAVLSKVAAMPSDIGGTGDPVTDSLEAIRDRGDLAWISGSGSGGAGTGARTIVITVDDGTDPLQNATIRITEGASTFTASTDVDGNATFNLDDLTYTVAITKSGHSFAGDSLVVVADDSQTYSMSTISITPGSGSIVNAYLTTLDGNGQPLAGVKVYYQMMSPPSGSGYAFDGNEKSVTSNGSALAQMSLVLGASYSIWRSQKPRVQPTLVTIVDDGGGTMELPSIIGKIL